MALHLIAHSGRQGCRGVAEVIPAAEAHQSGAGVDETAAKQAGELVQIEVDEREPVAEHVLADLGAPVSDRAEVQA